MDIMFHRPPNNEEFKQTKADKDILSYAVLFQCSNAVAYALFNPHLTENGKLNRAGQKECRQFFSHPNNIAYMNALREHLSALTKGVSVKTNNDIDEKRKDKALKSLLNQAMSLVENAEDLDAETLKTISEIFKKVGLLKEEEKTIIAPIRFLPARCSECRMKIAVESMVLNGEMLDMCAYCKARKKAEGHGYRFNEGKDLLDIPPEVISELESKNNVKLEDILK